MHNAPSRREASGFRGLNDLLPLAARFGMDAHTSESDLAELDPLPRHCTCVPQVTLAFVSCQGGETNVLAVCSPSETEAQPCELAVSSDEEPEAKHSNDGPLMLVYHLTLYYTISYVV